MKVLNNAIGFSMLRPKPHAHKPKPQKQVVVRVMRFKDIRPGNMFCPAMWKVTFVDRDWVGYHFRTERPHEKELERLSRRGIAVECERVKSCTFIKCDAEQGQAAGLAVAEDGSQLIFHPMHECAVAYWRNV